MAASAQPVCQMPQPADIAIIPRTAKLVVDTSASRQEISGQSIDTINPYSYNKVTHTNGFMQGQLKVESRIKLDFSQIPQSSAFCVWYEKVEIVIDITPRIVIASEVAADKCKYDAVLTHEKKHVETDRVLINKFAKTVGHKVFEGLQQRGFVAGPVRAQDVEQIAARMRTTVNQLVDFEYKKFDIERAEAQQNIDTLKEYEYVQSKCASFNAPVGASRSSND